MTRIMIDSPASDLLHASLSYQKKSEKTFRSGEAQLVRRILRAPSSPQNPVGDMQSRGFVAHAVSDRCSALEAEDIPISATDERAGLTRPARISRDSW
jgi:hypothetical protein